MFQHGVNFFANVKSCMYPQSLNTAACRMHYITYITLVYIISRRSIYFDQCQVYYRHW
jgi:hypothetical protein